MQLYNHNADGQFKKRKKSLYIVTSITGKNITGNTFRNLSLSRISDPAVPEFIDPVFVKTSPKHSFSVIENEHIGLAFKKTGSIISDTGSRKSNKRER
jgi:hypothetical protein